MEEPDVFVVYGTLKRGYGNHRLLDNEWVDYLGEVVSEEGYHVHSTGGFPMATPSEEGLPLHGEAYRVRHTAVVNNLDYLEGNGHFYNRRVRQFTLLEGGAPVLGWVYEIDRRESRLPLCPTIEKKGKQVYTWQ